MVHSENFGGIIHDIFGDNLQLFPFPQALWKKAPPPLQCRDTVVHQSQEAQGLGTLLDKIEDIMTT